MINQIKQAKINWVIPAKGILSDGIESREILVTRNYVLNRQSGNKTFFKVTEGGIVEEGVQFNDFQIKFDGNIGKIMATLGNNPNVFLSRFRTNNLSINLYANKNNNNEFVPYITVTTRSNKDTYYLLISNNNQKYEDIFKRKGRFVGYTGYNIAGCKFITVGHLANGSSIPLYIKNGEVIFSHDSGSESTIEKVVYNVKNLMLYNKDKSERILYKRLFTCESEDYKIDVKYMKILVQSNITFLLYNRFVDDAGMLRVDALKDLRNNEFESDAAANGVLTNNKHIYQFNVLYTEKNTGRNYGMGYSYFPITV